MTRRTAVALVAAMTTLVAFSHASLAKPKIAVLGLEVINPDGSPDAVTTNIATLFTKQLRQQATARTGPYSLAPNSKKDLLEMKLLSNCSDEGRGCMAAIGRELGADVLMYGKIEKRAGKGYHINLKLLDTKKAEMINVSELTLPIKDRQHLDPYAGRLYAKMVGMPLEGSLLLRVSNTDSGTVYVDGQIVGNLSAGSAKIPSITEGQRTLVIESEGFSRYSRAIDIVANQELDIEVTLEKGSETPSGRPGGTSRTLFWVTAGLTAVSAAGWSIEGVRVVTTLEDNKLEAMREYMGDVELSKNSGCADAKRAFNDGIDTSEEMSRIVDACNEGKRHATITNLFIVGTAASAALATFFYYKGYISPKSKYESKPDGEVAGKRNKEPETSIRVIPSVGPHSVGAGVTVEF